MLKLFPTLRKVISLVLASCCLMALLNPAHAWTGSGHRRVVSISWSRLTPDVQQTVMALLKSGDDLLASGECKADTLDKAASWMDCVRGNGPVQAAVMHADRTQLCPNITIASSCKSKHCATDALKKAIDDLSNKNNSTEVRRIALKMIMHLMGDLHQPLHAAEAADPIHNGGTMTVLEEENDIPIIMHSYWDYNVIKDQGSRKTHLNELIKAHASEWEQGSVEDWIHETVAQATEGVYKEPLKEAMCDASKMTTPILLTPEYKEAAAEFADLKIAQAGIRLAFVLNHALATSSLADSTSIPGDISNCTVEGSVKDSFCYTCTSIQNYEKDKEGFKTVEASCRTIAGTYTETHRISCPIDNIISNDNGQLTCHKECALTGATADNFCLSCTNIENYKLDGKGNKSAQASCRTTAGNFIQNDTINCEVNQVISNENGILTCH